MLGNKKPRIINVTRKPSKCPDCGSSVVDIIYGTGDMTEIEFVLQYRKDGIMGGDSIPRRAPIWSCSCGCKRFRKVNPDGSDATVKVKVLKNMRKPQRSIGPLIWQVAHWKLIDAKSCTIIMSMLLQNWMNTRP